jgi:hypothetical protein
MKDKDKDKVLVFVEDDVEFMKLVVDITLYWKGSAYDHRDGILHFYRGALPLIRSRLKFYERETMQGGEPLAADTFDQLPDWLAGGDPKKDVFTLDLQGGTDANIPSDVAFRFWADEYPESPAGMVRLVLPTAFVEASGAELLKTTLSLAGELHFHSGQAGYAINWDHRGELAFDARKRMGVLARRFPAIDLSEVPATLMAIPTGMKRINWVTLAGNALMEEKGLAASELDGLEVHPLPHGVAVVAGDKPRLGDVNRKEDLTAYHRVGKALAKLRSAEHPAFVCDQEGDAQDDLTEEWLSYFDS